MRLILALILSVAMAAPAAAQQLLAVYAAYIGRADLYNSQGQRLSEPWQILRQDRANFHRFGIRQFQDEWDPIFHSMDARAQFERLIRAGRIAPSARRLILQGDAMVYVEVYGWGNRLHSVNVLVER